MWFFWVLFAVIAVFLLLAMVKIERRRSEAHLDACRAAASGMGATYAYDAPEALLSKLGGFDLTYSDGERLPQSVRDVFTQKGPRGEMHVFLHEHRGTLPGGAGAAGAMAHRETVGCVVSRSLQLPRFRLAPERPAEKIISFLGVRDIDFDSHPGFSKSYFLHAQDESAGRRLFGPKVLYFFENHPGWHVEGRGDTLLAYRFAAAARLEELPDFFTTVGDIADLFGR